MILLRASIVSLALSSALCSIAQAPIDFRTQIQPIFEANCYQCHGPEKQRGRLRLDQRSGVFSGADPEAWTVQPGEPDRSELLRRISLPPDDFDIMPAEGEPLSAKEIALLRQWIAEGAMWPEEHEEAEHEGAAPEAEAIIIPQISPQEEARIADAIARIIERGGIAHPIAANSSAIYVNLSLLGDEVTDQDLALLTGLEPALAWLNLGRTGITDEGIKSLARFSQLRQLRLHETAMTDAGLAHLRSLSELRSLNLYGTKVADAGLDHLAGLRNLRQLYVWKTNVTEDGAARLRAALPGVMISRGADVLALPADATHGLENRGTKGDSLAYWFGTFTGQINDLSTPVDVAVADDGRIFVVERTGARVSIFDHTGKLLDRWGEGGDDEGSLLAPGGLAIGEEDVYITSAGTHQVKVFSHSGEFKRAWGGLGTAAGEFNEPGGIAIHNERIYITDVGNDRVQVFSPDGAHLLSFGTRGSGEGEFRRPLDVAVAESGAILIADADNSRVQEFNARGEFQSAWGEWGPFIGFFDEPSSITIRGDDAFIVDLKNHRVQRFAHDGTFEDAWGVHELEYHEGNGKLHYPRALAIAPDGSFAVICEPIEDRCQIFAARTPNDPAPDELPPVNKTNMTHFGEHIDIDGKLLLLAEPENHYNIIYDIDHEVPIIINTFGERGEGVGLLRRSSGLEIDLDERRIWITDPVKHHLQEFILDYDPEAPLRQLPEMTRFGRAIDLELLRERMGEAKPHWPLELTAFERDRDGHFLFIDQRNALVIEFDDELEFVRAWGGHGDEPGQFRGLTDLALSPDEKIIYIADSLNGRVQSFDRDGSLRAAWDLSGEAVELFGLASGHDGSIYLSDTAGHAILKLDPGGSIVARWGGQGSDMGQLWKPRGIATDSRGQVFVVDQGNHRAQIFNSDGRWLVTFGLGRAYTNQNRPPADSD